MAHLAPVVYGTELIDRLWGLPMADDEKDPEAACSMKVLTDQWDQCKMILIVRRDSIYEGFKLDQIIRSDQNDQVARSKDPSGS